MFDTDPIFFDTDARYQSDFSIPMFDHRLTILCLCGGLYVCNGCVGFVKLAKLKPKFRSLKTDENEIKTDKIAAMVF